MRVGSLERGYSESDAHALRHSFTGCGVYMEAGGLTSESAPWWSILAESSSMCSRVIPTTLPLGSSRLPRPPKGVCTSTKAKAKTKKGSNPREGHEDWPDGIGDIEACTLHLTQVEAIALCMNSL